MLAARWRLSGEAGQWLVIAALILFDLIGFHIADITPDWDSTEAVGELLLIFFLYGQALDLVRRRLDRAVHGAGHAFDQGGDMGRAAASLQRFLGSLHLKYRMRPGQSPYWPE